MGAALGCSALRSGIEQFAATKIIMAMNAMETIVKTGSLQQTRWLHEYDLVVVPIQK